MRICGRCRVYGMKDRYKNTKYILKCVYRIVFMNTGIYALLAPLYYLVEGIFPAVMTVLNARFCDYANGFIRGGIKDGKMLWGFAGVIVGIYLLRSILALIGSVAINMGIYERLSACLKIQLSEKCAKFELIDFEDDKVYNQYFRAKDCIKKEQISAVYMISTVLFSNALSVITATNVMVFYSVWTIPVALFSVLPYFLSYRFLGNDLYHLQKGQTPVKRKTLYLWNTLTSPESVRELRITNSIGYIEKKWGIQNQKLQEEVYQHKRKEAIYMMICDVVRILGTLISIVLTLYLTVWGKLSIGEFGACMIAYVELQNKAQDFFREYGSIHEKLNFARDYFVFMDRKVETVAYERQERYPDKIEMRNVSFVYPGTERKAVDDINLEIIKGESIIVVGRNGSGKTTLTKLLTGLYTPDSGQVLYDGRDLRTLNKEDAWKYFSIISQNFIRYLLTLRENVAISDIEQMENDERIIKCLTYSGMNVSTEELNQQVGKLFGGCEYSGGQWQRIAIARALFCPAELFIMDEPTSALDPILEAKILQKFLDILKEKTCMIVSHRIGLCRYVDKIVVMKDGKIVEIGNHEELYQKKGEYWSIFNGQSQWYMK